jgi:hypothetical protein
MPKVFYTKNGNSRLDSGKKASSAEGAKSIIMSLFGKSAHGTDMSVDETSEGFVVHITGLKGGRRKSRRSRRSRKSRRSRR